MATWQPSCQKGFEESGSVRKILDPYHMALFFMYFFKKSIKIRLLLYQGILIFKKYVILWTLSRPTIRLQTNSKSFHV